MAEIEKPLDSLEMQRELISMPDGRKLYRYSFFEDGKDLVPPPVEPQK